VRSKAEKLLLGFWSGSGRAQFSGASEHSARRIDIDCTRTLLVRLTTDRRKGVYLILLVTLPDPGIRACIW
jgi:hypothetical protein